MKKLIFILIILFAWKAYGFCSLVAPQFSTPLVDNQGNVTVAFNDEQELYIRAFQFDNKGKFLKEILFELPFSNARFHSMKYIDNGNNFWIYFSKEIPINTKDT